MSYKVKVFHGSGLLFPKVLKKNSLDLMESLGGPIDVLGPPGKKSVVVRADTVEIRVQGFVTLLESRDRTLILCADGGSGASRVVSKLPEMFSSDFRHLVVGMSDSSLYALFAFIRGFAYGMYGVNLVDDRLALVDGLDFAERYIQNSDQRFLRFQGIKSVGSGKISDDLYTLLPVSIRPLTQLSGKFRMEVVEYLRSRRVCLMVDDGYPPQDLNWLGFYEDLSLMTDFIEAVAEGEGALCFGPVPGVKFEKVHRSRFGEPLPAHRQIIEMLQTLDITCPVFCDVHFGHHSVLGAPPVIPVGAKVSLKQVQSELHIDGKEDIAFGGKV